MDRPSTITFFGNFGTQNLGNECTLRAIIQNTRKHLPMATVIGPGSAAAHPPR